MKPLRVGIIGQGRSGRDIHAANFARVPALFKVVAVAEEIRERRERAAVELVCDVCENYRDLLKRADLDLIVNASYSHQHVPISLACLKAGFNVLCEKPLASHVRDVDRLIAAEKASGKCLAVYQQSRFSPYFEQVQKVIRSRRLGRIVQISIRFNGFARRWDWQTLQAFNGGSLLNTGPHPLDQALQLFGEGMPEVVCQMDRVNSFGDAEDHVKLWLRGFDRPLIDLEVSSCDAFPGFTYKVYGRYGGLQGSTSRMDWKYFKPSEAPRRRLQRAPISKPDGSPAYCQEALVWHSESWENNEELFGAMGVRFCRMLHKTLTRGAPLEITLAQVRRQIAVIEICRRQNRDFYQAQP